MRKPASSSRIAALYGWRGLSLCFLAAVAVVIARRPDAVFHAQFCAEDGTIFYAAAHNFGWWRVLLVPYEGYLHLLPRLGAGLATLFPLAFAPLVENLVAIAIETIPVLLLVSPVCEKWGSLRFRLVLAVLYLAVPNCGEMVGTMTESQWILALAGFLVITGSTPKARVWCGALLALCCFTGPFCLFLLPFALWMFFRERSVWRAFTAAIVLSGASVQGFLILTTPRHHASLGASVKSLFLIVGGQIYGGLIGPNSLARDRGDLAILIAICGVLLTLRSRRQLGALYLFAGLILAASLISPTLKSLPGYTVWQTLAVSSGARYWFFPCVAVLWSVAYACCSEVEWVRAGAVFLSVFALIGILRDFRQPPYANFHFAAYVAKYEASPSGNSIEIPEAQDGWSLVLVKR